MRLAGAKVLRALNLKERRNSGIPFQRVKNGILIVVILSYIAQTVL